MNTNQNEQELMKKAAARVGHRIGLIVHIIFWLVISAIIMFAIDLKTGLMLFAFFGLTVVVNIIAYFASSHKSTKGYKNAVQREYERMKSDK